jgi:hypothetical protein
MPWARQSGSPAGVVPWRFASSLPSFCGAPLAEEAAISVLVDLLNQARQGTAPGRRLVSVPAHVCPLPEKAPLASPPIELELRDIDLGMARRPAPVRASLEHDDIVSLDPVLEAKLLPQIWPSAPLAEPANELPDAPEFYLAECQVDEPQVGLPPGVGGEARLKDAGPNRPGSSSILGFPPLHTLVDHPFALQISRILRWLQPRPESLDPRVPRRLPTWSQGQWSSRRNPGRPRLLLLLAPIGS